MHGRGGSRAPRGMRSVSGGGVGRGAAAALAEAAGAASTSSAAASAGSSRGGHSHDRASLSASMLMRAVSKTMACVADALDESQVPNSNHAQKQSAADFEDDFLYTVADSFYRRYLLCTNFSVSRSSLLFSRFGGRGRAET